MTFKYKILIAISLTGLVLTGCEAKIDGQQTQTEKMTPDQVQSAELDVIKAAEIIDLTTLTCWDISTLPEADAGYAAVLLYGYGAGQSGAAQQSGLKIEAAIVKAMETCIANPEMMALGAFN